MNKLKKLALGIAAVGVLLLGIGEMSPVVARALGRMYGNSLHIENEPRANTSGNFTLGNNDAYIKGKLEVDGAVYLDSTLNVAGQQYSIVPATQTLTASGTITADACGGLKRVTCSGDITTSTTLTLTAPSANAGCRMKIENVANLSATACTLYLDSNNLFPLTQGFASMALAPGGSIDVFSDGSSWLTSSWTEF